MSILPMYIPGYSASAIQKVSTFTFHLTPDQLTQCSTKELFNDYIINTCTNSGIPLHTNNILNSKYRAFNQYGCGYALGVYGNNVYGSPTFTIMQSNATFIIGKVPVPKKINCTMYLYDTRAYAAFGIIIYNTKNLDTCNRIIKIVNSYGYDNTGRNWSSSYHAGGYIDHDNNYILPGYHNPFVFTIDVKNDCPTFMSQHEPGDMYYIALTDLGSTSTVSVPSAVKAMCIHELYIEF